MKAGWTQERVDQLCNIFADGDWIESKDQSPSGVRLVQTGNIGNGEFKDRSEKARYISDATFDRLRCTELREGDCLVSRLPDPVGRSCLIPELPERAITAVDCTIIRFEQSKVLSSFFVYFSQSIAYAEQVARQTGGATRQRISRKNLGQVSIPLPPLEEQRRIVAVLDEAFAAIATATANAKKNLADARELFPVIIEEMIARCDHRADLALVDTVEESCSLSYGIVQPGDEFLDGLPIVRPTDMQTEIIRLPGLKRINPKLASGYARTTLRGNELLLCVRGTTGTLSIAAPELAGANVTRGIVPIRFDQNRVLQKFGYYLLLSSAVQDQISKATYGTALMQINIRDLKKLKVSIPPIADQIKVVRNLDSAFADLGLLEANQIAKLSALTALKLSLLHRAFTGELTVTSRETIAA